MLLLAVGHAVDVVKEAAATADGVWWKKCSQMSP